MVEKKKTIEGVDYIQAGKGLAIDELRKKGMALIAHGKAAEFRVVEITHRQGSEEYARIGHRKKEYGLYIK